MRRLKSYLAASTFLLNAGSAGYAWANPATAVATPPPNCCDVASDIVVTASRSDRLGTAETASQGTVTPRELDLRPVYRVGQLLEATPGLIVTAHSGEGKANQYLIRGFNLDHGTDIAIFVAGMPVNRPTNAHGQGYSDLNFIIPELLAGVDYTKGPYYAAVGDFGAVASTRTRLLNELPTRLSVSAGTLGDQNIFGGGTVRFGADDRLIVAADYGHLDGPWTHPDDFRKVTAALRYTHGTDSDGFGLTALGYRSHGNFTTDQPRRAVAEGLIDRFGSLDPSDGSRSGRISMSGHYAARGTGWQLSANVYYINSQMTLWNNFTHFLDDPVNGDQEKQFETRNTWGGAAAYTYNGTIGRFEVEASAGLQTRYDSVYVQRQHTKNRMPLDYCSVRQPPAADGSYVAATTVPTVGGACQADRAHLLDVGPYAEATLHWTPWLRTVTGVREEFYRANTHSFVESRGGSASQKLFQPKGSLIFGPWRKTELYFSAGRGFHSDDVRGVVGTFTDGLPATTSQTLLLAPATGAEVGIRTRIIPRLELEAVAFQLEFTSEIRYNQDIGQDQASAPSRRQGIELSGKYRPLPWLEANADLTFSKARYRGDLAAFGFAQPYIANAPVSIASFGLLVDGLGRWSGGLQVRRLGPFALNDGTRDPRSPGFAEANFDVGYKLDEHWSLSASVYNLTNSRANAGSFYYVSRLTGEPLAGVADHQDHPLEPISGRFTVTATF